MSGTSDLRDKARDRWQAFSERERRLLLIMVGVLSALAFLAITYSHTLKVEELQDEITERRDAVDRLIREYEPFMLADAQRQLVESKLEEEPVRLSTFIEARASRAGIGRPSEIRDRSQPLDGGITKHVSTAVFATMTAAQLNDLLSSVAESDELVFADQIAFQPPRGGNNTGMLAVELTLATFSREAE
ncbi:MAG: hypothetical protein ACI81R_003342 [Bradymonadia bacterium]|jgi:hypothetical protein